MTGASACQTILTLLKIKGVKFEKYKFGIKIDLLFLKGLICGSEVKSAFDPDNISTDLSGPD
jgi:hypothetical protein